MFGSGVFYCLITYLRKQRFYGFELFFAVKLHILRFHKAASARMGLDKAFLLKLFVGSFGRHKAAPWLNSKISHLSNLFLGLSREK